MSQKHIAPDGAEGSASDEAALLGDVALSQLISVSRGDS